MLLRKQNTHCPAPSLEMSPVTHVALSLLVLIKGPHFHDVLLDLETGTVATTPCGAHLGRLPWISTTWQGVGLGFAKNSPWNLVTSDAHGSENTSSLCALPAFPVQGGCEPAESRGLPRATACRGLVASCSLRTRKRRGNQVPASLPPAASSLQPGWSSAS